MRNPIISRNLANAIPKLSSNVEKMKIARPTLSQNASRNAIIEESTTCARKFSNTLANKSLVPSALLKTRNVSEEHSELAKPKPKLEKFLMNARNLLRNIARDLVKERKNARKKSAELALISMQHGRKPPDIIDAFSTNMLRRLLPLFATKSLDMQSVDALQELSDTARSISKPRKDISRNF
jgi:hypothetical protein